MRLKLLFATLFMLVYGLWSLYRVSGIHQVTIPVHELEQGAKPAGVWLKVVDCRAMWDKASLIDDHGTYLIPVASDTWQSGSPVAVLMEASGERVKSREDPPGSSYEGVVPFGRGVGSTMYHSMGQEGITIANNCTLISYGANGQTARDRAWESVYIGMGLAVLLQLISWFLPRGKKPVPGDRIVRRRARYKQESP